MSDTDTPGANGAAPADAGTTGAGASVETPTIRVGGFLALDGKILMVQQGRGDAKYWLLPGGGVRFGESLAHALIRETHEELGLRVAVGPLLAIVESISPEPDYPKHVVHLIFEVSAAPEADLEPREEAILGARFLDELEVGGADVRPPIAEFLTACLRERPSSPQYLGRRW
jgi:ADP-ribose pyrophosphatase YjhB (NUDIX family)